MNGAGDVVLEVERFRSGASTPTAYLQRCLDAIERTEGTVRAWTSIARERAAALAEESTNSYGCAATPRRLEGIPVGIKDLIDVAGFETLAGSRHLDGNLATSDAACVGLLRRMGAIVLGKTVTHEFAFGGTSPPCRNPWDTLRIPGGSSGGSAAAVAAGHCPLALGTDTAGSIRIPSSYCGVVGLKPTSGAISLHGVIPLAWSLDTVGPIARTTSDLAAAWTALNDGQRCRSPLPGLEGRVVGLPRRFFSEQVQPAVGAAVERAVAQLVDLGARTVDVDLQHAPLGAAAGMAIMLAESGDYHRERIRDHPELFAPDVRHVLQAAQLLPATDYVRAQRIHNIISQEIDDVFQQVDLLCLPTLPCTAPSVIQSGYGIIDLDGTETPLGYAQIRNTVPFNLAGVPALTQPCGLDGDGLPIGLQWIARRHDEISLLAAATAFEAACPFLPRPQGHQHEITQN